MQATWPLLGNMQQTPDLPCYESRAVSKWLSSATRVEHLRRLRGCNVGMMNGWVITEYVLVARTLALYDHPCCHVHVGSAAIATKGQRFRQLVKTISSSEMWQD
jgi:hypothetical protein